MSCEVDDEIKQFAAQIEYSEKVEDDVYEYRWVTVPRKLLEYLPTPWPGVRGAGRASSCEGDPEHPKLKTNSKQTINV